MVQAGLATLIKLTRTRLDEQRQMLMAMLDQLERVECEIAVLEARRLVEQQAVSADPTIAFTYGEFLRRYVDLSRNLMQKKVVAANAVEAVRVRITALFEEQKRYELTEATRLEAEKREEARLEMVDLDESGRNVFLRKQKRGK